MKRVLVLGLMLACGAALAEAGAGDTMAAAVFDKWLTPQTVAFDNLRYGGTYTVLVFWNQGMYDANAAEAATATPGTKAPVRTRQCCGGGSGGSDYNSDRQVTDFGATRWIADGLKKYPDANVVFVGVFGGGQYILAKSKFPGVEQVPQMQDHAGITARLCGLKSESGFAVLDPSGAVVKVTALADFRMNSAHIDDLLADPKSTIHDGLGAFRDLPAPFEQLAFDLRNGHYAAAYRTVMPYLGKGSEAQQQTAKNAMTRISAYQAAVRKEIDACTKAGRADEAYRLATRAFGDFQNIDCEFTAGLKATITACRKDAAVKNLEQARKLYDAAFKFFADGKDDFARQYLAKLAETFPDTYYGRLAARLLKAGSQT